MSKKKRFFLDMSLFASITIIVQVYICSTLMAVFWWLTKADDEDMHCSG